MNTVQFIVALAAAIIVVSFVVAWIGKPKKSGIKKGSGGANYPDQEKDHPNNEISDGK